MNDTPDGPKAYDLNDSVPYAHKLGFKSLTKWGVRTLIAQRRLRPIKIGRKFYIPTEQLDGLVKAGKQ
jgi:hypothetical protein